MTDPEFDPMECDSMDDAWSQGFDAGALAGYKDGLRQSKPETYAEGFRAGLERAAEIADTLFADDGDPRDPGVAAVGRFIAACIRAEGEKP